MKRITVIALFALATLATVGTAAAQNHQVRANIPFDFVAGDAHLPAGSYSITSDDLDVIAIRNGQKYVSLLRVAPAEDVKTDGKLIFNRYGDQYFLSEILSSDANMKLILPVSKLEKRVRFQKADLHADNQASVALGL